MLDLPKQQARKNIGAMLAATRWAFQDYKALNPSASIGVVPFEMPLKPGRCVNLQFVNRMPLGATENKREDVTFSTIAEQSADCAKNLRIQLGKKRVTVEHGNC